VFLVSPSIYFSIVTMLHISSSLSNLLVLIIAASALIFDHQVLSFTRLSTTRNNSIIRPKRIHTLHHNHAAAQASIGFPHVFPSESSTAWIQQAASHLRTYGACALLSQDRYSSSSSRSTNNENGAVMIDPQTCNDARLASTTRLQEMHRRIESRGVDPTGTDDGPYRFQEVICRDEGGRRFDVPVPWLGTKQKNNNIGEPAGTERKSTTTIGSCRIGTPLLLEEKGAIQSLHEELNVLVEPIANVLWSNQDANDDDDKASDIKDDNLGSSNDSNSYVAAAGFLINEPGSSNQKWHRDGPDEGFIDAFVPLVDLTHELGPTAIQPSTHTDTDETMKERDRVVQVVPILIKGEVLLFDYRTLHRGQGNKSEATTRALAYAVYKRQTENDSVSNTGDIHNFQSALTLEYD
jgi:hypothetical protein